MAAEPDDAPHACSACLRGHNNLACEDCGESNCGTCFASTHGMLFQRCDGCARHVCNDCSAGAHRCLDCNTHLCAHSGNRFMLTHDSHRQPGHRVCVSCASKTWRWCLLTCCGKVVDFLRKYKAALWCHARARYVCRPCMAAEVHTKHGCTCCALQLDRSVNPSEHTLWAAAARCLLRAKGPLPLDVMVILRQRLGGAAPAKKK